jgi:hypothetical protein
MMSVRLHKIIIKQFLEKCKMPSSIQMHGEANKYFVLIIIHSSGSTMHVSICTDSNYVKFVVYSSKILQSPCF